jgi:sterol desaturase/sphingolipid hydroxylase (fatty acid hydroxylase superfamily)
VYEYLSLPGETKLTNYSFGFYGLAFFGIILVRYFISAGATHLLLYGDFGQPATDKDPGSWLKNLLPPWRFSCRQAPPTIKRDIKLSVLSSIIFALGAASIMSAYDLGSTRLYSDIHQYPLWYLGVSYVVSIVLQDTYFYFLHRLFHHPLLFRWWHQGHHLSKNPTPWTSFAFDPPEAIAQALFLVAIVFLIPLHFITVIAVLSTMTVWGIVNHLGIEQLPADFPHHWCGRWFTGPAHHAIHHRQYTLHYGLYFTFWDRQLGTQSLHYEEELADVTH